MTLVAPFEELYRSAPCGLIVTTADGTITEANDTIIAWIGTERAALVGSKLTDYLDAGSRLFFETRHAPVLALQGEVQDVSLTMIRADGKPIAVLINSAVRGDAGDVHTAVFDATARAEYEKELLGARRIAESSEIRVRVLQQSSNAFVGSTTEEEICDALLSAAKEAFSPTEAARRAEALIPDVEIDIVADAGHALPLSHTDHVVERMGDFLRRHAEATPT